MASMLVPWFNHGSQTTVEPWLSYHGLFTMNLIVQLLWLNHSIGLPVHDNHGTTMVVKPWLIYHDTKLYRGKSLYHGELTMVIPWLNHGSGTMVELSTIYCGTAMYELTLYHGLIVIELVPWYNKVERTTVAVPW